MKMSMIISKWCYWYRSSNDISNFIYFFLNAARNRSVLKWKSYLIIQIKWKRIKSYSVLLNKSTETWSCSIAGFFSEVLEVLRWQWSFDRLYEHWLLQDLFLLKNNKIIVTVRTEVNEDNLLRIISNLHKSPNISLLSRILPMIDASLTNRSRPFGLSRLGKYETKSKYKLSRY